MRKQKSLPILQKFFPIMQSFFLFFGLVAFVITCSFLVFFSSVTMSEADIRAFAPVVFFNVFALTAVLVICDLIRRKLTVDRPAREIQKVLKKIKEGAFDARISISHLGYKEYRFRDISESINLLAEELGSVETLRTDFIANVSHELKTPLAVIQNYGTMLQNSNLSTEDRLEYAKAITDASRRLANLITNILKLNKLENQQIFPSIEEYDLGEQICESILQFEDFWEQKNIEIETDLEDNVKIRSDAELLSLVWNNLISNAVKFTPAGGKITVTMKSENDHVTVSVSDTGCGIKPEVGEHIFEKFYQGDTSHATQGNGLGLALVKRVVDIMNGEIGVESIYGEGSTFTVKIREVTI